MHPDFGEIFREKKKKEKEQTSQLKTCKNSLNFIFSNQRKLIHQNIKTKTRNSLQLLSIIQKAIKSRGSRN